MNPFIESIHTPGLHQLNIVSNGANDPKHIYILLHGYSESGFKIYKRLGHKIDQQQKDVLVLAPDGLFPLPKSFPLDTKILKSKEELLQGFAWYFYHAVTDQFLIDYDIPAQTLAQWIQTVLESHQLSSDNLTIIGYSQGGYLAPFLGEALEMLSLSPNKVIGINCSFREDKLQKVPNFPLSQIQGKEDKIIDTKLCFERFQKLKARGLSSGDFYWLENEDHKLSPKTAEFCLKIASDSQ